MSQIEEQDKILDVDEKLIDNRVKFIQKELLSVSDKLRKNIPEIADNEELIKNEIFKQWFICNTIYDSSLLDEDNTAFNRLLYYMYDNSGASIPRLLSNYDMQEKRDAEGNLIDIGLIIIEPETADE